MDHNGEVDLTDNILGLQILSSSSPDDISTDGDINNDGKVGMEEILHGLKQLYE